MIDLLISIITVFISFSLSLILLAKNRQSATNVYFALLIAAVGLYPIFNFLALQSDTQQEALLWGKAILLSAIPVGPLLYSFVKTFPSSKFIVQPKAQILFFVWAGIVAILAIFGLVIESVEIVNQEASITFGPAIPFFGLLQLITIGLSSFILVKKLKRARGKLREQLRFVTYGIIASFSLTLLSTVILPLAGVTLLLKISPLFLLLAGASCSYAILRHRLFDIRLVIARSVTYVLLLGALAGLYSLIILNATSIFSNFFETDTVRNVANLAAAMLLAFTFQPLKKAFDALTHRIFYQDAYDLQQVLSELSEIMVTEIDIETITEESVKVICEPLKSQFGELLVVGGDKDFTVTATYGNPGDLKVQPDDLTHQKRHLFLTDEVTNGVLKESLSEHNVAVSLKLIASEKVVGFLLLGHKQGGNSYTPQDIRLLEIIASDLAIAIQNALQFEEIKNFSETLQKKVNVATSELKTKNYKLRELDKAKDDFISMASHQLRTPLTTVKGYLSMLNDGDFGKVSKKQQQILELAYNSSERMVYLIADLLNVSRINTGKFVIDKTEVDLWDVVKSEVNQLESSAKAHNVTLETKLPKSVPTVMLDESKIRQVMMNFIDNAIYYTPDGGKITVKLGVTKDALEFTVTDTGIGVPKDEQEHMFTKFYRAKNARQARPDGTGLGLYLAKKVVTAQGGSIIFKSKEGKGSTFGFRFSLATIAAKKSK